MSQILVSKGETLAKVERTVVITGAFGALGRRVAKQFAQAGYHVTGIGHGSWRQDEFSSYGLHGWLNANITTESLLSLNVIPDAIIHCAGSSSVAFSNSYPCQDFERTVSTTMAVLEFVVRHSAATRIVYPSSAAVYGAVNRLPIGESDRLLPVSPYGTHKLLAEELLREYARLYGLSVVIVRLFSVYGEGLRKQLLWDACMKLKRNENTFSGSGTEIRDWLHLQDAAELIFMAGDRAAPNCPIVNGGSGFGVSVKEIVEELFNSWGFNGEPTFDRVKRSGDPSDYQADISLARNWGWSPTIPWRKGVREYVKWFQYENSW